MKADKKCGNCEWWRKAIVTPNEKRYCFAVEPYEGDVMPCGENCVCKRWSANLDGAACGKCVYWIPSSYEKTRHLCKRHAPKTVGDHVAGWGSDWMYTDHLDLCGEFVPGVV
jgi:hypothetical protein